MKRILLVPVLVLLIVAVTYNLQSQDKTKKEKTKAATESCGTEQESCGTDIESCGGCGHEAKVKTTSVKPWNSVCPVQGEKVDPKVKTVKYNGKDYGFCCSGCDEKFEKNPAKYAKNLSKDGKTFIGTKS